MTENSIALCETDSEYLEAMASYLMEHIPNVAISTFTSVESFLNTGQGFKVGIMSREFLAVQEFSDSRAEVEEKIYLCDEEVAAEYEHLPMVYKYQSMDVMENTLKKILQIRPTVAKASVARSSDSRVFGIYSPISHELSMPFALALCQVLRESGSVLFLDIEEISIMSRMIGRENEKGLMDLLYMVMQPDEVNLADYVSSYMGIDIITPFANPEDLNEIRGEVWGKLMNCLLRAGYDSVVILYGRITQGFKEMAGNCDEFLALGKPGDYYRKSQERFLEYIRDYYAGLSVSSILLPMSASNLVDGTYALDELIQGNLGLFVKKLIKDGTIAKEELYERAG